MIKKTVSSIKMYQSFSLPVRILTYLFILGGVFFVLSAKAQVRSPGKKEKRQSVKTNTGEVESRQCSDDGLIKNVELNGIRLALSKADVEKNLFGIKWTYRPERNITFGEWNSSNDNFKKQAFADVASVQFELVDEKVFYYLIEYKNSAKGKSTRQFIEDFSRTANLPRQYWQISNNGNTASIICGDYLLEGTVTDAGKKLIISVRDFSGYAAARKGKNS